jgi:hypothetical protein
MIPLERHRIPDCLNGPNAGEFAAVNSKAGRFGMTRGVSTHFRTRAMDNIYETYQAGVGYSDYDSETADER